MVFLVNLILIKLSVKNESIENHIFNCISNHGELKKAWKWRPWTWWWAKK